MTTITTQAWQDALSMFTYLLLELTLLFIAISYLVGVIQLYVPPEKIKDFLSSKHGKGYVLAALMGAMTPFCSCSTIPFLKGLIRANAGFGPMMVFLFSSPLLNPILIVLFAVTFSLKIAATYFVMSMGIAILAGITLERLGFEKYIIAPEVALDNSRCCTSTEPNKWHQLWLEVWRDFKQAFPYLLVGVSLGAIIHGFVPTNFITTYAGGNNALAIPFAAVIGIPLYTRAIVMIPLAAAFVAKGMGIGAVMAFVIGSAGASIPELILLRSLFKTPMIVAFIMVVLSMAITVGYVFSYLF
ncbi:MAG: permease [Gammaproteobacteria bacterium]|nr:permease [Gammaproteobacteria bacterium]